MTTTDRESRRVEPAIALGTPLQLTDIPSGERLATRFVGMAPGTFWIVADPGDKNLAPGRAVGVRYSFQGALYGFDTTVLSRCTDPAPLLFLRCPGLVGRELLRSAPRIPCQLPCTVVAGEEERPAKVLDISSEGCLVALRISGDDGNLPFDRGDALVLQIKLPGIAYEQLLWGEVSQVAPSQAGHTHIGLRFDPLDVATQGRLAEFITSVTEA